MASAIVDVVLAQAMNLQVVNMHEGLQGLSTDYILYIDLLLLTKMSPLNVCWFGKMCNYFSLDW